MQPRDAISTRLPHALLPIALAWSLASCGARTGIGEGVVHDASVRPSRDGGVHDGGPRDGGSHDDGPDTVTDAGPGASRCRITPVGEPIVVFRVQDPARLDLPQIALIGRGFELIATEHGATVRGHRARYDASLRERRDLPIAEDTSTTVRITDHSNQLDVCFGSRGRAVIETYSAGGSTAARAELPALADCRAIGPAYPGFRVLGSAQDELGLLRVELRDADAGIMASEATPVVPSGGRDVAAVGALSVASRTTMWAAGAPSGDTIRVWFLRRDEMSVHTLSDLAVMAAPALGEVPSVHGSPAVLVARDPAGALLAFLVSPVEVRGRLATGIDDAHRDMAPAFDGTRGLAAIAGMTYAPDDATQGTLELVVLDVDHGTEPSRLSIPVRYPEVNQPLGGVDIVFSPTVHAGLLHWSDWVPSDDPLRPAEHVTRALRFTCEAL